MDKVMYDLKDLLKKEIQKVVDKHDITPSEMESVYKATCTMEKICKMEHMENEKYHEDSSNKRFYMAYDNDMSNRVMRGPDGRFMSSHDYPYHHDPAMMSYEHDRSNHSIKDRMIDKFERMMDDASTDYERQELQNWIMKIRESK